MTKLTGWKGCCIFLLLVLAACAPVVTPTDTAAPFTATPTITASPISPTDTPVPPTATATAPAVTPAQPTVTRSSSLTETTLTKGPDVIYTGENTTMKIFWQHSANTSFSVDWGTTTDYEHSSPVLSAYDTTNHLYSYTITGLTPGARYYYRVVTGTVYSGASFYAAPDSSATRLKFISYGDDRSNPDVHNAVAGAVVKRFQSDPGYQTLNLAAGDLVASGDQDSSWTTEFFDPSLTNIRLELASIADLSVMGNHEGSGKLFMRYFPMPFVAGRYWSFDYGPMHVVMMDQYSSYDPGSAQYDWIRNDLAATTRKWKVVLLHEPGWSADGGHPNNTIVQQAYQPLFEQYGVALVIGGHNHYYARAMVNGIPELTVGTGGAPLYSPAGDQPNIVKTYAGNGYAAFSIDGNVLSGSFIATDGTLIDTFTVTR
jgi:hypothetical protein